MKIGFYNPYFDSFGGGERYVLSLAAHWSKIHDVSIFWEYPSLLEEANKRFDLDLTRVRVEQNIFHTGTLLQKLLLTRKLDCLFVLSDGSIPTSLAKYNILHFQVPFSRVLIPAWKARMYKRIVCNSNFTKKYLDPSLNLPRTVIYPPVDMGKIVTAAKTKTILGVGRFSALYGAKKQDILINTYRKMCKDKRMSGWTLILAGGVMASDKEYFEKLKNDGSGLPVTFYPNCSFVELQKLYSTASLYWHAAGFGETKPEHMEHFGITTVEAMSASCVPIVYRGGGQAEIISDGESGFLWNNTDELIQKTFSLINNKELIRTLGHAASIRAKDFSLKRFTDDFDRLLEEICIS
jgi:glycosyltransferase involved in cell wall biosynthesis